MNCSSESPSVLPALELRGGEEVNDTGGSPSGGCQTEPAVAIFTCNVCLACFLSDGDLKIHGKKIHDIAHPFICNLCGYRFSSETNLRGHRKEQHVQDRKNGIPSATATKPKKRKFQKNSQRNGVPLAKLNGNEKACSGEPAKKKIKKSSAKRTVPKVLFPCKRCNIVYETFEQWREHAVFDHIVAKNPYPIVELNFVSPLKREASATRSDSDEEERESSGPTTPAPPKLRITLCKNKGETYRVKKTVIDNLPQEPSSSPAASIRSESTERLSPISVKSEQSENSVNTHCSNENLAKLPCGASICPVPLSEASEEPSSVQQEGSSIKNTAFAPAAAIESTLVSNPNASSKTNKSGMEENNGSEYILGLDPRDYDSDVILPDLMSPPFSGGVSVVRDASKNDGLTTPRPPDIEATAQERPVEPVSVITATPETRTRIPQENCGNTSTLVFDLGDALRGNNEFLLPDASREEGEDRLDKSRQTSEEEAQAVVLRMVEAEQESPVSRLKCPPPPASDQESVIRSNGRINETADVGRVSVPEAVNGARNNEDVSINLVNAQERGQPTGVITANHGRKLVLEKFVHEEDSDSDSGLHIHLSEEHSEDTSDAETRSPYSVKGNEAHQANDSFPVKDSTKDAKSKDSPLDCSKAQEEGELHCSVCKKRFSTDGALHKHFSDEHLSIRMNSSIFEPESPAPVRLRRDIFEEEEPERETATPFVQPSEQQMNSGNTGTSMPPRPMPVYNQTATNLAYQEQSRQNSTLGGGKAGMIIVEPPQPMFSLSTFDLSNTHQQALGHSGLAKTNSAPPPLQPAGSLVRALGNNVPPNSNRVYREEYRYQQQFRLPFTPPEQNHTSGSAYKSSAPFKPPGVTGNTDPDVPRIVQVTSMQQSDAKRSVPPGQLHTEMRENNYPPNYFNSRSLAQPDYEHQSHIYLKNALANKRSSRDDSIEASKRAKVDVALSQHPGNSIDKLPTYQQASNFDQRAMSVLPRAIAYPPNTPSTLSPTLPRQGSSPNGTACAVNTTQSNNMRLGNAATLSSCPTTGSAEQYQYHQNSMMTSAARGNPAAFNQSRMSQTHQQFDMEAYARMYEASKNQVTAAAAANARAAGGHQFAVPKHPAPRTVTNTSDRTPTIDLTHEEFLRNVQNNIQNNRVNGQQQYPQMPQHPQRIQQRPAANQTVPSKNLERQTTYSCPICRASFISIQMYEEHLRVFHGHLQPQNSSQQPRLSPPVRNRDSDIELSRHNGSRAPPQNISPQPQQSAGPQNPVRNVAPKSLCIPILDFNKVDAQKLRKLEELGITGVIPLAGYDKSVGSLGIPIMPLRPERTIGAQLPWESVLPLGPAHLPSLLTNGMAAFRDYEHQTQSSRMQSPR